MESFIKLVLGLLVLGVTASLLGGSVLPLLVVGAVIWTVWHFFCGLSGGGKRLLIVLRNFLNCVTGILCRELGHKRPNRHPIRLLQSNGIKYPFLPFLVEFFRGLHISLRSTGCRGSLRLLHPCRRHRP